MKKVWFILFMIVYMPAAILSIPFLILPYMVGMKWAEKSIDWIFDLPDKLFL
jgi:hypothetical protein